MAAAAAAAAAVACQPALVLHRHMSLVVAVSVAALQGAVAAVASGTEGLVAWAWGASSLCRARRFLATV